MYVRQLHLLCSQPVLLDRERLWEVLWRAFHVHVQPDGAQTQNTPGTCNIDPSKWGVEEHGRVRWGDSNLMQFVYHESWPFNDSDPSSLELTMISYDIYRQRGEHLEDLRGTYSFPGPCSCFLFLIYTTVTRGISHSDSLVLTWKWRFVLVSSVWKCMKTEWPKTIQNPVWFILIFPLNLLFFGPWGVPHFWPIHIQTSPGYHPSGPACACSLPFKTRLAISIRL